MLFLISRTVADGFCFFRIKNPDTHYGRIANPSERRWTRMAVVNYRLGTKLMKNKENNTFSNHFLLYHFFVLLTAQKVLALGKAQIKFGFSLA